MTFQVIRISLTRNLNGSGDIGITVKESYITEQLMMNEYPVRFQLQH